MTDTETPPREPLPFGDPEYITEIARGVVTGKLLVADLSRREWQTALALSMEHLASVPNIGLILVPFADHASLYWINGIAPGMVIKAQLLAREDLDALNIEVERMHKALNPSTPDKENTMKVNGVYAEPGLIVDGDVHQDYTDDRLADIAVAYGIELTDSNDPRYWRGRIAESEEQGDGMAENHRDALEESSTALIELLNAKTEGGYFEWEDGSVWLREDEAGDE